MSCIDFMFFSSFDVPYYNGRYKWKINMGSEHEYTCKHVCIDQSPAHMRGLIRVIVIRELDISISQFLSSLISRPGLICVIGWIRLKTVLLETPTKVS